MNQLKTVMLLAALTALFMVVGFAIGGRAGAMLALVVAAGMNLFTFWNADKIVLKMHDACEVDERTAPEFVRMIRELAERAKLPMPRVYIVESPHPNAFATGRNPENAAVAATRGLLELLSPREVRGVMAHELAHVRNRDTLVMTMVATIAGAISMIANFGLFFRSGDNRGSMMTGLLAVLVAPFAAMIVQMAISRTREYGADAGGAEISGDPGALASALDKLASGAARTPNHYAERNPAAAQLYIVPVSVGELFSTHPDTGKRVAALRAMAANVEAVDFDPPSPPARPGTASVPSSRHRASALDPHARRD